MSEIRIPVPRMPAGAWSNLLGLAGLVAIAAAVGALAGNWWWSSLVGGVMAVGLAVLAQTQSAAGAEAEQGSHRPRLEAVPKSA